MAFRVGFAPFFVVEISASLLCILNLDSIGVYLGENESQFFKVAVCYHPIRFVQNKHINHGQLVKQFSLAVVLHQLPKTAWSRHNDLWFGLKNTLLLLDGHSSDYSRTFDLMSMLGWNDCFDVVLDLDCQFTCR